MISYLEDVLAKMPIFFFIHVFRFDFHKLRLSASSCLFIPGHAESEVIYLQLVIMKTSFAIWRFSRYWKRKACFELKSARLICGYFERKQPQKRIYWWSPGIVQKQWPRGTKSAKKIANCWEVRRHSSSGVSDRQLGTRTFVLLTWRLLGEMASLSAP